MTTRDFIGVAMEAITTPSAAAPVGGPAGEEPGSASAVVDPTNLVEGVTLRFEPAGLTVVGPDPGSSRTAPWEAVAEVQFGRTGVLPGGALAVSLSAVVSGWFVRWWVPWSQIRPSEVAALGHLPASLVPGSPTGVPYRRTVWVLLLAIVALLVAGGVVLAVDLTRSPASSVGGSASPATGGGDRVLAAQVNLHQSDLPGGWVVDSSTDGPLSSFLGGGGGKTLSPAERRQVRQVSQQYEGCMGISAADDRVFGTTGPSPSAQVSSPAYARTSTVSALEVGSQTAVYRSAGTVSTDLAQITDQRFPGCFGAAIGSELVDGATATSGSSGVTYGTPSVTPLDLPQQSTARAVGVDLTVPITEGGQSTTLQLGFVFVGGGRVESTLVTFGTPDGFPPALASTLAGVLQKNIVAKGSSTGT